MRAGLKVEHAEEAGSAPAPTELHRSCGARKGRERCGEWLCRLCRRRWLRCFVGRRSGLLPSALTVGSSKGVDSEGLLKASPVTAEFEDARELLHRLTDIAAACSSVQCGASQQIAHTTIQRVAQESGCTVWLAQMPGCSIPCLCSSVELAPEVSVEAAVWAIYSIQDRLEWDGASFVQYDALCEGTTQSVSGALADAVYCRMRAPAGISDRDVVQERFLLRTPSGGYAIVMCSPSDTRAAELGKPPTTGLARAATLLSGYVVEPCPSGGVLLFAMSQTDLGGSIPGWAQNLAKKASKRKLIEWTQQLQAHCLNRSSDKARARQACLAKLGSCVEAAGIATGPVTSPTAPTTAGLPRQASGTEVHTKVSHKEPGSLLSAALGLALCALMITALPGWGLLEVDAWGWSSNERAARIIATAMLAPCIAGVIVCACAVAHA